MSNYTGYNMPTGCSNVDIPGFYACTSDGVEELCEQEGYDWELLSDESREKLAVILMSSESRAIAFLNRLKAEEGEDLCD